MNGDPFYLWSSENNEQCRQFLQITENNGQFLFSSI